LQSRNVYVIMITTKCPHNIYTRYNFFTTYGITVWLNYYTTTKKS